MAAQIAAAVIEGRPLYLTWNNERTAWTWPAGHDARSTSSLPLMPCSLPLMPVERVPSGNEVVSSLTPVAAPCSRNLSWSVSVLIRCAGPSQPRTTGVRQPDAAGVAESGLPAHDVSTLSSESVRRATRFDFHRNSLCLS